MSVRDWERVVSLALLRSLRGKPPGSARRSDVSQLAALGQCALNLLCLAVRGEIVCEKALRGYSGMWVDCWV